MATTVGGVITRARDLLQDVSSGTYRHSDDKLYRHFNDALLEALRLRPDLFLSLGFVAPSFTPADASAAFPLDDRYFALFSEYVAGFTELGDDEFNLDGRAVLLLSAFRSGLTGAAPA
jgi:hypothetical protein